MYIYKDWFEKILLYKSSLIWLILYFGYNIFENMRMGVVKIFVDLNYLKYYGYSFC